MHILFHQVSIELLISEECIYICQDRYIFLFRHCNIPQHHRDISSFIFACCCSSSEMHILSFSIPLPIFNITIIFIFLIFKTKRNLISKQVYNMKGQHTRSIEKKLQSVMHKDFNLLLVKAKLRTCLQDYILLSNTLVIISRNIFIIPSKKFNAQTLAKSG